ncbi:MAG TPA: CpaF family protein [Geminicoccaceae bacterium]|jgi:pilus assembly protein CpaF|nr:CpaF family protein [Geminicoccaceae bacterium]
MFRHFEKRMPEAVPARANGRANPLPLAGAPAADGSSGLEFTDLKVRLHQRLLDMLNLGAIDKVPADELQREVGAIVRELLLEDGIALNAKEYSRLVEEILDEVLGLGPLEPLLKDPTVSDILVNTHARVFVERLGQIEATPVRFKDDRHLLRIIDKIVSAVGRRVDESQPWVDARLADGSRVNALIPPCAVDGPLLSIRKFAKMPFSIDRLIEIGSMTDEMAQVLRAIVASRLNVLISGGTGSGKTTMLNALSSFVSERERIVTIEDTAELQLQQIHIARMETRPANIEGKGEVTQRDLVRNALRMRPDRIIVGEVRGAEVLDMLQAMNTGHEGSMTTIHANSPRDALARLEHMIGMTGIELPMRSMRAQIASALHVVIQLQRMSDGRRRLVSVQEITGMEGEVVSMQEIFRFERTGIDAAGTIQGHYAASGVRPKFARRFEQWGVGLGEDLFNPNTKLG